MLNFTLQASGVQQPAEAERPATILLQIAQFQIKRAESHTPGWLAAQLNGSFTHRRQ